MQRRQKAGFTLVELLCVMAIILILAGLMLGPVMRAYRKAKNFAGENNGTELVYRFIEKLRTNLDAVPDHPPLTIDQLYDAGIIDSPLRTFLKDKSVQYFPFSSKAPDHTVVLQATLGPKNVQIVFKGDLKPPEN
jgi:prepilin-type N-terminal cleavage/methylation domain-containing protein